MGSFKVARNAGVEGITLLLQEVRDMAVSIHWGSFERGQGSLAGLRDSCKPGYSCYLGPYDTAVCVMKLGFLFASVLLIRALLLEVYIGVAFFGNSHLRI